jgi:hypothetical protein
MPGRGAYTPQSAFPLDNAAYHIPRITGLPGASLDFRGFLPNSVKAVLIREKI